MKAYRKRIRLSEYDYSAEGAYFVTICTEGKRRILSEIPTVGADDSVRPYALSSRPVAADDPVRLIAASSNPVAADDSVRPTVPTVLLPPGKVVEDCILALPTHNLGVLLDKFVIMPNHIHLLLRFVEIEGGQSRPPLQKLMQSFKSVTTRKCWEIGISKLWQRSFYDHVIRNDADYLQIWQYIDENPLRWSKDIFFESSE